MEEQCSSIEELQNNSRRVEEQRMLKMFKISSHEINPSIND